MLVNLERRFDHKLLNIMQDLHRLSRANHWTVLGGGGPILAPRLSDVQVLWRTDCGKANEGGRTLRRSYSQWGHKSSALLLEVLGL